eukprot:6451062-Amphidinium_carterae.1
MNPEPQSEVSPEIEMNADRASERSQRSRSHGQGVTTHVEQEQRSHEGSVAETRAYSEPAEDVEPIPTEDAPPLPITQDTGNDDEDDDDEEGQDRAAAASTRTRE